MVSVNYTVAFSPEYFALAEQIDKIAYERHVTRSVIMREALCKALNYDPAVERKRLMFQTEIIIPERIKIVKVVRKSMKSKMKNKGVKC
jgi:hypothetical protein